MLQSSLIVTVAALLQLTHAARFYDPVMTNVARAPVFLKQKVSQSRRLPQITDIYADADTDLRFLVHYFSDSREGTTLDDYFDLARLELASAGCKTRKRIALDFAIHEIDETRRPGRARLPSSIGAPVDVEKPRGFCSRFVPKCMRGPEAEVTDGAVTERAAIYHIYPLDIVEESVEKLSNPGKFQFSHLVATFASRKDRSLTFEVRVPKEQVLRMRFSDGDPEGFLQDEPLKEITWRDMKRTCAA